MRVKINVVTNAGFQVGLGKHTPAITYLYMQACSCGSGINNSDTRLLGHVSEDSFARFVYGLLTACNLPL